MSAIPARLGRDLLDFLDAHSDEWRAANDLATRLRRFGFGRPRKSAKPARARREEKRAAHRDEMAEIRAAVMKRAGGACEQCEQPCARLELDHWLSGSGRRRPEQSVASTWALCGVCHHARTKSIPDAEWWNRAFAAHCAKHGYAFRPHLVRRPLVRRTP